MRNNLQGTGTIVPGVRKNLHILAAKFHPGARKIKVLLLSLSTYSTMAGLAAAWHLRGVRARICLVYTESNVN